MLGRSTQAGVGELHAYLPVSSQAHIPSGFLLKYVCIIRDVQATYGMHARRVHMPSDIRNMQTGCVNACVCVCVQTLLSSVFLL